MAYCVMPYRVGWEKLKKISGSHDTELITRIIKKHGARLGDLQQDFNLDPVLYLTNIINGTIKQTDNDSERAVYGYSFELICDEIGSKMSNSEWSPASNWYDVNYFLDDVPFNLPNSFDFPDIKIVAPENTSQISDRLMKIKSISDNALNQFLFWLKRANETHNALILFYY